MTLDGKLRRERRSIVLIESVAGGVSVEIRPLDSDGRFAYGHAEDRFIRFEWPEGVIDHYAPPAVKKAVEMRALASAEKYARSLREAGHGEIRHFDFGGRGWFEEAP